MSRRRRAPRAVVGPSLLRLALAASCAVPPSTAATADTVPGSAALAQCVAIAAAGARLACYDALAGRPAAGAVAPPPAAPMTDVVSVAAAPAATGATAGAAKPAPPPDDPQNFGIAQVRVNEPPKGPAAIQAHVAQWIDNGIARATVVLDNGQTWTFAEAAADSSLSPGDAVVIKRALLGSFLLVTPSKHSYHVHRVR